MLKKLFSITELNETHNILRILGIKIKFPKQEIIKIKKQLPYETYKQNNADIKTLPPAIGQLRDVQLANFALLKELDYVCRQNNLRYWIDFGTLLGATRHKGFIPWDDDIDTGMLREDYNKIIEAFEKSSRDSNIYADYYRCPNNPCQIIIKVQHKKCPHLFVDIFPYDYTDKILNNNEQLNETLNLKSIRTKIESLTSFKDSNEKVLETIQNSIFKGVNSHSDLAWGIDFNHHWKNWFTSYEDMFPLKEIIFENISFPCINNIEGYLTKVYGNYMNYPKKFGYGHSMFAKLTEEEKAIIKDLIES